MFRTTCWMPRCASSWSASPSDGGHRGNPVRAASAMRTSLLISFLLGAALLPAQDREFGSAVRTTLTQIRAEPDAYTGVKVVFPLQFASLGKLSNPFFTKFTPADFANFYAGAEEQPLSRREAYEDLFGTLFYAKLGPKLEQLYQLRVYQRLQV